MERELADRTWTDLTGRPVVLVPVGSCEQHGPHLPLGTDTLIATAVARGAAARFDTALVAPAVAITASGEHQGFPGTLSIGTDALVRVLVELVRSAADWTDRVVLVNGHGGNADAIGQACEVFERERRPVTAWWPDLRGLAPAGDLHAGRVETSLVLALAPDLVRDDAMVAGPSPTPPIADLVRHGVAHLSPNGVLGDPDGASAAEGRRLLELLVDQLASTLQAGQHR